MHKKLIIIGCIIVCIALCIVLISVYSKKTAKVVDNTSTDVNTFIEDSNVENMDNEIVGYITGGDEDHIGKNGVHQRIPIYTEEEQKAIEERRDDRADYYLSIYSEEAEE